MRARCQSNSRRLNLMIDLRVYRQAGMLFTEAGHCCCKLMQLILNSVGIYTLRIFADDRICERRRIDRLRNESGVDEAGKADQIGAAYSADVRGNRREGYRLNRSHRVRLISGGGGRLC